jgi:hypothetical protein
VGALFAATNEKPPAMDGWTIFAEHEVAESALSSVEVCKGQILSVHPVEDAAEVLHLVLHSDCEDRMNVGKLQR